MTSRDTQKDARIASSLESCGLKGVAGALDEVLEAHRRPMPVALPDHAARAIPERVECPDWYRGRLAGHQRAPLAVHGDVEAPL
jgi:hypothetical protein